MNNKIKKNNRKFLQKLIFGHLSEVSIEQMKRAG